MIQNQTGAGQAPLGNFCDIARCPVTYTSLPGAVLPESAQGCMTGTWWFQ